MTGLNFLHQSLGSWEPAPSISAQRRDQHTNRALQTAPRTSGLDAGPSGHGHGHDPESAIPRHSSAAVKSSTQLGRSNRDPDKDARVANWKADWHNSQRSRVHTWVAEAEAASAPDPPAPNEVPVAILIVGLPVYETFSFSREAAVAIRLTPALLMIMNKELISSPPRALALQLQSPKGELMRRHGELRTRTILPLRIMIVPHPHEGLMIQAIAILNVDTMTSSLIILIPKELALGPRHRLATLPQPVSDHTGLPSSQICQSGGQGIPSAYLPGRCNSK